MSNLFRKQNLERISSPEQLNSYIRASTPSVWLLLSAIIVLLVGMCVWCVFGHMDTTLLVLAVSEDGTVTAYVCEADAQKITIGATVSINGTEGSVLSVKTSLYAYYESDTGKWVKITAKNEEEGIYLHSLLMMSFGAYPPGLCRGIRKYISCTQGTHTQQNLFSCFFHEGNLIIKYI